MIQAIAFDAVGTLIHPTPAAADVYAAVGRSFGSQLSTAEIRARFRTAFLRQEQFDHTGGLRTDERRERERWRAIVAEVLSDVVDQDGCFAQLHEHFARPGAWAVTPTAATVLPELRRRGLRLVLASNYDGRLRPVWAGLPALSSIDELAISAEIGWRKPAGQFFAALCRQVDVSPAAVLFVGDDRANDFDGAHNAGLRAVLYDPAGHAMDLGDGRIEKLEELLRRAGDY